MHGFLRSLPNPCCCIVALLHDPQSSHRIGCQLGLYYAAINSSKAAIATASIPAAITATKRPSPEPAPAARKIARTSATTATAKAASNVSASTAAPMDTALSPATLQFLLQQQTQTPSAPQLFTKKISRKEIEETLTRLLEATRYLLMASQEAVDDNEDSPIAESEEEESDEAKMDEQKDEQSAGQTHHGLKTQPGIKTDDIPSSTDLKKMTSKERRQLRNKISARNFRVRRKGEHNHTVLTCTFVTCLFGFYMDGLTGLWMILLATTHRIYWPT